MKTHWLKHSWLSLITTIAVCGMAVGCGDKEPEVDESAAALEPVEPPPPPKPPIPEERPVPNVKPAAETSFADVAQRLDIGGNVYAYLSTEQWVKQLNGQLDRMEPVAEDIAQTAKIGSTSSTFKMLRRILERSGLQEVTGVGYSAFSLENGLHRSKTLLKRKPDGTGYVWTFAPPVDDPLPGIDLLPVGTVYANFANLDYAAAWKWLSDEVTIMGSAEIQEEFAKSQDEMRKAIGVDVEQFLGSITDGVGVLVTSNPDEQLTLGDTNKGKAYKIDRPDFALIIGTTDSTVYDAVLTEFGEKEGNKQVLEGRLRMLVMDPLNEENEDWRWTLGFDGEHLMFATSESILKGIAKAKAGNGLRNDTNFEKLASSAPPMGRIFSYSSDRFAALKRDLHLHLTKLEEPEMASFFQGILEMMHPGGGSVSVMQANADGWLWTTMSTEEPARQMLTTGIIKPLKLIATIVIPNFKAGRARAQRNSCVKNQEKIDEAKRKWAERIRDNPNAVPSTRSLLRIMKVMPTCPNGGTYEPRSISEICTCTHPGHSRD